MQPKPEDYGFDLDRALASVVSLRAMVPEDAFTAETLGTERAGNGVIIGENGLILTVGYLVMEAESVWVSLNDGRVVPAHVAAFDGETGFGLLQALARVDTPALPLGDSASAQVGERVIVAGGGGRARAVAARIAAKQEFAGYWEYVLDEAIFTAPSHPNWGGTAMIGHNGELLGVGSLQLQQSSGEGRTENLNMMVPIDLLKPILGDLLTLGRPNRAPRPWLGLYATEVDDRVVIAGVASHAPAQEAGLKPGDVVLDVGGAEVNELAGLFRRIWSLGPAGVEVPLRISRDGRTKLVTVSSVDRSKILKAPRLH